MKSIKESRRWRPENEGATIKSITTAPLTRLAQGRLVTKVKKFIVVIIIADVGMWATPNAQN